MCCLLDLRMSVTTSPHALCSPFRWVQWRSVRPDAACVASDFVLSVINNCKECDVVRACLCANVLAWFLGTDVRILVCLGGGSLL